MQKTAPQRNTAGIMYCGRAVFRSERVMCGTAMPTNEMGPAKAVTQAESTLERRMISARNSLTLMPMLFA